LPLAESLIVPDPDESADSMGMLTLVSTISIIPMSYDRSHSNVPLQSRILIHSSFYLSLDLGCRN
jgi:hypothetical protein